MFKKSFLVQLPGRKAWLKEDEIQPGMEVLQSGTAEMYDPTGKLTTVPQDDVEKLKGEGWKLTESYE